ncbi:hypothetical protein HFO33_22290 [Rhizobium leguminosarum]|uniref:hypothetical protein n=1 Tax=Rhizobium leguminosarum TaxID=384 RepID=UPI001C950A42|nr:hypothetical protein [Rhizobium leguminosarum]MBY5719288.1 hypothetical protein [Rhizobium leguminosarum]
MIYVFQDESLIPKVWIDKVAKLQKELEKLATQDERKVFISKHDIWGDIKDELLAMSHNKCWYSEAPDAVSDWHVDHFRPKARALDEDKTVHDGYTWLAFDWKNYRIAGSYPNSPHKDGTGQTRGKWDHFPLGNGGVRARWDSRDCTGEICLILDPAKKNDPKLLTFDEDGLPRPSDPDNAIAKKKVETTVHLLYLDSPRLVAARKKKWRDTYDWIQEYRKATPADYSECTALDFERLDRHLEKLSELTGPQSEYASTARACLRAHGLGHLIQLPEEVRAA